MSTLDITTSRAHEQVLNAALAELDERHFGGKLVPAGWHVRVAALAPGHYGSAKRATRRIEIAAHTLHDTAETRRTLVHEMIHTWLFLTDDPSHQHRNESHGAAFAAEIARLAAEGEDVRAEERYAKCGHTAADMVEAAAAAFLARKRSVEHPRGSFDSGGRWYLSSEEHRPCCNAVRSPSCSCPYSLMTHCRTIAHVARLHGVDTVALRAAVLAKQRDQPATPGASPIRAGRDERVGV